MLYEMPLNNESKLLDTLEFMQYGRTSKWEAQDLIDVYLPKQAVFHLEKDDMITVPYNAVKYLPKDKLRRVD